MEEDIMRVAREIVRVANDDGNLGPAHSLAALTLAASILCENTGYTKEEFGENLMSLDGMIGDE